MKKILFILLTMSLFSTSTYACKCSPAKPIEEELPRWVQQDSDKLLVLATVTKVEEQNDKNETHITTFEITENFSQFDGDSFQTKIKTVCCVCGIKFTEGESYLVYANKKDDKYFVTSSCSRTKLAKDAESELDYIRTYIKTTSPKIQQHVH